LDEFRDQADDEFESSEDEFTNGGMAGKELVPVEFAKAHIMKIEEDMKKMHERHVKLMREMDTNYKMIE